MKISENTPITIGVIISLVGAIAFVTRVHYSAEAAQETLKIVANKQDQYNDSINEIKTDIAVIKTILKEEGK